LQENTLHGCRRAVLARESLWLCLLLYKEVVIDDGNGNADDETDRQQARSALAYVREERGGPVVGVIKTFAHSVALLLGEARLLYGFQTIYHVLYT
jgi:hypothetical protein